MTVSQHEPVFLEAPPEPVPRLEDIPFMAHGLDPDRVSAAFAAFEQQLSWYRARQGTALPAVPSEPVGHDLRGDAMRLIRAAVEFADIVERDAQEVACRQVEQAGGAIRLREAELEARESALRAESSELERRRASMILAARREAEEIVAAAMRESAEVRREAEAARLRIVEECRHHATDLANASRADVERTLEWARAQAEAVVRRGRAVAEQLVAASLRGQADVAEVVAAIVRAAEEQVGESPDSTAAPPRAALPVAPPEPEVRETPAPRHPLWEGLDHADGDAGPSAADDAAEPRGALWDGLDHPGEADERRQRERAHEPRVNVWDGLDLPEEGRDGGDGPPGEAPATPPRAPFGASRRPAA